MLKMQTSKISHYSKLNDNHFYHYAFSYFPSYFPQLINSKSTSLSLICHRVARKDQPQISRTYTVFSISDELEEPTVM